MIVGHQHAHREERRGGIPAEHPGQADGTAGQPGERADLQQHVLVEDAPPQRLVGHPQDVMRHPGHHGQRHPGGQPAGEPAGQHTGGARNQRGHPRGHHRRCPRQGGDPAGLAQDHIRQRHHHHHHRQRHQHRGNPGHGGDQPDRCQAGGDRAKQAHALADERGFFLLERAQLARVVQFVADVPQRRQDLLRGDDAGVVVDQRLLMRQAHRDLADPVHPAQRLLDRAGAQRAVQARDPGPDPGMPFHRGRLGRPQLRTGLRAGVHDRSPSSCSS